MHAVVYYCHQEEQKSKSVFELNPANSMILDSCFCIFLRVVIFMLD